MKPNVRELAERSARACAGGGDNLRGICLACPIRTGKPDRRGCFSFAPATGWYFCHKCGLKGRVEGYESEEYQVRPEADGPPNLGAPDGFFELCRGDGRGALSMDPFRDYLRGRGLRDEGAWSAAHVGGSVRGRYKDRLVVPVLSPEAVWMGFVTRDCTGKAPNPYLYPPRMDRANLLYNHAALLRQTDEPVMVVEGALDALALWPNAVALLGKPSEQQVLTLADAPRPVAVVLDGDAWQEGAQLAMRLGLEGQRAGNVRLPPKKDPDEVDKAWLAEEVRRCLA